MMECVDCGNRIVNFLNNGDLTIEGLDSTNKTGKQITDVLRKTTNYRITCTKCEAILRTNVRKDTNAEPVTQEESQGL
jgi:hypothetical protein